MNKALITIMILIIALCCAMSAAGLEDFHYTCELSNWDIAALSGKEFNNLYLDVEGCGGYTIVEGIKAQNVFYNGGRDTDDHMIMFVNSSTVNFYMPCEDSHQCYLTVYGDKKNNLRPIRGTLFAMPSGGDKGRVIIESGGDSLSYPELITIIKFIIGNDAIRHEIGGSAIKFIPEFSYPAKTSEIELNYIHANIVSLINSTEDVVSSVKMGSAAFIMHMADPSNKTQIYHPGESKYKAYIHTYTGLLDGIKKELSIDDVQISVAHVLGNNNKNSVFSLKTDSNNHKSVSPVVKNLFLFGSNIDLYGASTNHDNKSIDINNLVVLEQPQDYYMKYDENKWYTVGPYYYNNHFLPLWNQYKDIEIAVTCPYKDGCEPNEFELLLDSRPIGVREQHYNVQATEIRVMSVLTKRYTVNNPDSTTHWHPYIDLYSASIGKVICAKSITNETPNNEMFRIMTNSYISGQDKLNRIEFAEEPIESLLKRNN